MKFNTLHSTVAAERVISEGSVDEMAASLNSVGEKRDRIIYKVVLTGGKHTPLIHVSADKSDKQQIIVIMIVVSI